MTNPFFEPSTLPYGLPPFAEITDEHYLPAFEKGFADHLVEIAAITDSTEEPSFENTLIPLEISGQLLERVSHVFFNKCSSDSNDVTNELEETLAPLLAAHADAITLNAALFSRIEAVHSARFDLGLDAESRYLVERYYSEYTIAGAGLADDAKATLREYNKKLSSLTTRFEKNLLADTNDLAVTFTDVAELDGLEPGEISAAAEAANERGLADSYLGTLVLPTAHP
eukprot:gene50368-61622_t